MNQETDLEKRQRRWRVLSGGSPVFKFMHFWAWITRPFPFKRKKR
jgi:hypothetical protein